MTQAQRVVWIDWTTKDTVSVFTDRNRKARATVPLAAVRDVPSLRGATVIVPHSAGPRLLVAAARAVVDNVAASAFIASDTDFITELTGASAVTMYVWSSGDPTGHPAARVHQYATGGDQGAMARTIGAVFDPRWYSAPVRPSEFASSRPSRIESRLGLDPRWDSRSSVRRNDVTAAWRSADGNNFFDRMYHELVIAGSAEARAERKVGRYFVRCMLAAWADAGLGEPLFDPVELFGDRHAV